MIKIIVDCEPNDPVDIKCGGPQILGFDFFVKKEDTDDIIKHIEKCLKKYHRPLISIRTQEINEPNIKIWDKNNIEECIKEGY